MKDLYAVGSLKTRHPAWPRALSVTLLVTGAALLCGTGGLKGQDAVMRTDSARTAYQSGRLPEAIRLLSALTSDFPDDAGLHWLYGQVLGSAAEPERARGAYRRAVALTPADPWLRLEFGRFLVEDGAFAEGIEVLDPVRGLADLPSAASEAETLTGLAQYWDGDLSAAESHLLRALDLDPDRSEASGALADVRPLLATSITAASSFSDDDQPLQMLGQSLEVGWALGGRARAHLLGTGQRRSGTDADETTLGAAAGVAVTLPGGRARVAFEAGAVRRGGDLDMMPIGAAELRLRVAPETFIRAGLERAPYLWTVSSLDTAVAVSSLDVRLDRAAAPAWAGEAVMRLERFPDGNVVRTLSGWFLAPALVRNDAGLRVGYAGSLGDSRSNTFRAADVGGSPTGTPGEAIPGVYAPYFTPEDVQTHSLILEGRGGEATGTSLRVTGVYAPWAREFAPAIFRGSAGEALAPEFNERSFTPWTLRAEVTAPASSRALVSLSAEHRRTAFYSVTQVEAAVEYRFAADGSEPR